jgi:hypothetical protein
MNTAMKLFGVESASFVSLAKCSETLNQLQEILTLYVDFREATRTWSGTLFFSELDMQALNEGIETFIKRHKKLNEAVQKYRYDRRTHSFPVGAQASNAISKCVA